MSRHCGSGGRHPRGPTSGRKEQADFERGGQWPPASVGGVAGSGSPSNGRLQEDVMAHPARPRTLDQCKIICFARWLPIVQKYDDAYCLPKGVGSQLGVLLYCHSDTLVEQLEEGKAAVVTWGRWAGTSPL